MPPLRRPVLLGALTAIVALFIVTPVASSSFLGDDLFNSNMNGYLSANHLTLLQMSWVSTSAFLVSTSRFLPASPLEGFGVFTVFHDLAAYKAFQVGMLLLDLVLFGLFLRALRVGVGAAALSGLLVAATMQFHGHYDGYLACSACSRTRPAIRSRSYTCSSPFTSADAKGGGHPCRSSRSRGSRSRACWWGVSCFRSTARQRTRCTSILAHTSRR